MLIHSRYPFHPQDPGRHAPPRPLRSPHAGRLPVCRRLPRRCGPPAGRPSSSAPALLAAANLVLALRRRVPGSPERRIDGQDLRPVV
ncbi:hypothetical protein [Nonomuraea sp. NPDC005650]|uniref:hypothetical protein n=1 Tax=Nonomuraea sp. NPDC005650 TaxID=3157045 RepID=UPI0033A28F7A